MPLKRASTFRIDVQVREVMPEGSDLSDARTRDVKPAVVP